MTGDLATPHRNLPRRLVVVVGALTGLAAAVTVVMLVQHSDSSSRDRPEACPSSTPSPDGSGPDWTMCWDD
jgi:hypothetical protein